MFNFEERRVSLRMEVSSNDEDFFPMGRVDVVEYPGTDKNSGCSCTMTEFQTGRSEKLMLRLQNSSEKEMETFKVFNFFRRVLDLPESQSLPGISDKQDLMKPRCEDTGAVQGSAIDQGLSEEEDSSPDLPLRNGMPERSRGAQESPAND